MEPRPGETWKMGGRLHVDILGIEGDEVVIRFDDKIRRKPLARFKEFATMVGAPDKENCRNDRYLREFFGLSARPQLAGFFPDPKEVTESFGAWRAVHDHLPADWSYDSGVTAYVVGDGSTARTGSTVAFRSKWDVVSIDPNLKKVHNELLHVRGVERLRIVRGPARDLPPHVGGRVVALLVHSHAPLVEVDALTRGADERIIVSIPCCEGRGYRTQEHIAMWGGPTADYEDYGIWSPKRRVLVWVK